MKILRPGVDPERATFSAKCGHCSCEFEFERQEATLEMWRNVQYMRIACPTCKREIQVEL